MLPDAEALVLNRPSVNQLKQLRTANLEWIFHQQHPPKWGPFQLLFLQGTHCVVYSYNSVGVNPMPESNLEVMYKIMVLPSSHVEHIHKKTTIQINLH